MTLKIDDTKVGDAHSEEVCRNGYPSVFAHGMLSMGMTGKMLTNFVGDGRLRSFGVRFTAQVFPGATLTASATITDIKKEGDEVIAEMSVTTVDSEGTEVLKGTATALMS